MTGLVLTVVCLSCMPCGVCFVSDTFSCWNDSIYMATYSDLKQSSSSYGFCETSQVNIYFRNMPLFLQYKHVQLRTLSPVRIIINFQIQKVIMHCSSDCCQVFAANIMRVFVVHLSHQVVNISPLCYSLSGVHCGGCAKTRVHCLVDFAL